MGIINRNEKKDTQQNSPEIKLTKEELEFLLKTIANSTFSGKEVQMVYDVAVKLQQTILNEM